MYAVPQPGVQLESAAGAGAGGSNHRAAQRPPSQQERFMAYVQATQNERV
jgi:hypothetical protein